MNNDKRLSNDDKILNRLTSAWERAILQDLKSARSDAHKRGIASMPLDSGALGRVERLRRRLSKAMKIAGHPTLGVRSDELSSCDDMSVAHDESYESSENVIDNLKRGFESIVLDDYELAKEECAKRSVNLDDVCAALSRTIESWIGGSDSVDSADDDTAGGEQVSREERRSLGNVDSKGRILLPRAIRHSFGMNKGDLLYLTPNLGDPPYLEIRTASQWEQYRNSLRRENPDREVYRYALMIKECSVVDGNGRIMIPQRIRATCALDDEVVFIDMDLYVEVWCKRSVEEKYANLVRAFKQTNDGLF